MKTKLEFTRENLQKLQSEGYTDINLADMFGKSQYEISKARKRSSYWEGLETPSIEAEPQTPIEDTNNAKKGKKA